MTSQMQAMEFIYHNHKLAKELSLSRRQVEIISWLKRSQATSRDLAEMKSISVHNASQQLKSLYKKGYLLRNEIEDTSGGYIFEYTSNIDVFGEVSK